MWTKLLQSMRHLILITTLIAIIFHIQAVAQEPMILEEYPNSTYMRLLFWSPNDDNKEYRLTFECDWKVHPNPETVKKLEFNIAWVGGDFSNPLHESWIMTKQSPWIIEQSSSREFRKISFNDANSNKKIEIYTKLPSLNSSIRVYNGGNSPIYVFPVSLSKNSSELFDKFINHIRKLGYIKTADTSIGLEYLWWLFLFGEDDDIY